MTAILVSASVTLMAAGSVRAESLGAYVPYELRQDDKVVIICIEEEAAIDIAKTLNETYLRTRNNEMWGKKMDELFSKYGQSEICFIRDMATHFMIGTVYEGSDALKELDKRDPDNNHNMNVVATSYKEDGEMFLIYIPTMEDVPPIE